MNDQSQNTNAAPSNNPLASFKPDFKKILQRVQAVLLDPKGVWGTIKSEQTTTQKLYMDYLAVLAAIPALSLFIGLSVFGMSAGFLTVRAPFVGSLIAMIVGWALQLAGIYVLAVLVSKIAPKFEAACDELTALKYVGYSLTPYFVAGTLFLFPTLINIANTVGLVYSGLILFLGIIPMTNVPSAKQVPFWGVVMATTLIFGYGILQIQARVMYF